MSGFAKHLFQSPMSALGDFRVATLKPSKYSSPTRDDDVLHHVAVQLEELLSCSPQSGLGLRLPGGCRLLGEITRFLLWA